MPSARREGQWIIDNGQWALNRNDFIFIYASANRNERQRSIDEQEPEAGKRPKRAGKGRKIGRKERIINSASLRPEIPVNNYMKLLFCVPRMETETAGKVVQRLIPCRSSLFRLKGISKNSGSEKQNAVGGFVPCLPLGGRCPSAHTGADEGLAPTLMLYKTFLM